MEAGIPQPAMLAPHWYLMYFSDVPRTTGQSSHVMQVIQNLIIYNNNLISFHRKKKRAESEEYYDAQYYDVHLDRNTVILMYASVAWGTPVGAVYNASIC